jgi:3-oxoacyl-[acyl-carrier protein] reductase
MTGRELGLLAGRTAVVTGAARGLGFAIADLYARNGATVVLSDVDDGALRAAVDAIGRGAIGVRADVTSDDDVRGLVDAAVGRTGRLDIMVNNAGIMRDATIRRMPLDDFEAVIGIHLTGTWLGIKHASAAMRAAESGGVIVNMSSISGKVGNPGQTNYSAAKAGIVGMTKAAAKELGFAGIRVVALQPGIIETPMTAELTPALREQRLADIPLGRFGTAEDVADAALFLASDLAAYLTGITLEVAGGRHV